MTQRWATSPEHPSGPAPIPRAEQGWALPGGGQTLPLPVAGSTAAAESRSSCPFQGGHQGLKPLPP